MVVKRKTKKHPRKLIFVIPILIIIIIVPIAVKVTNTKNTLEVSITSIGYEFYWLSDAQTSHFSIHFNITIENNSLRKITIIFGDGCLWDTQIECSFTNTSLSYDFGDGACTLALVPIVFQPGTTKMGDIGKLWIYNYTLPVLPEGMYNLTIGEKYSKHCEEIKDSAKVLFEVMDGILIWPTE